jgi:hypothetical protein
VTPLFLTHSSGRYALGFLLLVATVPLKLAHAQQQPRTGSRPTDSVMQVGLDRPVAIGARGLATVEPHLVADTRDPNHLLAGVFLVSKLGDPRDPNFTLDVSCAALTSRDAGQTWARHDFNLIGCGDPWVAALPGNRAVFLALARGRLFAMRSSDGGRTWTDSAVSLGRGDHGTLTVDATDGPFSGSVYAVWWETTKDDRGRARAAVLVARSTDRGATFGAPTRIIPFNLPSVAMNAVVLSDGLLVVPFMTLRKPRFNWVVTSQDGAKTFSIPQFVTDTCDTWSELAADSTRGAYRDRLYWVCGTSEHIYVLHSTDRGETWSAGTIVNQGLGPVHNPVVTVNRDGVVGVSWYDAREDPRSYRGEFACQHVFFTASLDGGQSFLPEVKVSSAENCSDTPANGEAGRRWKAGGDYHGLAAAADGRFHILWADSREGIYQLRTASIRVVSKSRPAP